MNINNNIDTHDSTLKKYYVTIEEVISETFEVMADSVDSAKKIAEKKYKHEEIILSPGNLIHKQMRIKNETHTEATKWIEF